MRLNLDERNIFLLDGVGAVATAILNGLVLPLLAEKMGLEVWVFRALGGLAFLYAIYSLSCFALVKKIQPVLILFVIVLNLAYCSLTGLILLWEPDLTILGRLYFVGEMAVILAVVVIEARVYSRALAT